MKRLLNEVRRLQKIAGIISEIESGLKSDQLEEMHVDASGNLISDEEFVKQVMWKHSVSLGKALRSLHRRPGYQKAKDFIRQWLKDVAEEIGLDPIPSFDDPILYQGRQPGDMLNYIRNLLTDMLKAQKSDGGEGELTEDDYDMGPPSGDTDAMNIAEVGDIDLSDTPQFSGLPSASDVVSDPSFEPFMDDGDWNNHRFGFAEIKGRVYYIPNLEMDDEDEMEVFPLKKGISLSQLIDAGVKKGYFEVEDGDNYFNQDLEVEIDEWINSLLDE